jgi:hypothetical protein
MEEHPYHSVPPPQDMFENDFDSPQEQLPDTDWTEPPTSMPVLIAISPQIGYFLAGGAAGMISRTTTAPLDRLKVYLIAQTGTNSDTLRLAKSGAPLQALRGAMRSTSNAVGELWAAGGIRSLFAGWSLSLYNIFTILIDKATASMLLKLCPSLLSSSGSSRYLTLNKLCNIRKV